MEWAALALTLLGVVIGLLSYSRLGHSGFDGGSFELAIVGMIVGAAFAICGLIWLALIGFTT